jgi:hypothetical protein
LLGDRHGAHTQPPEGLPEYYRQNVIGGQGSFLMVIQDFTSFGEAITNKLVNEIAARDADAGGGALRPVLTMSPDVDASLSCEADAGELRARARSPAPAQRSWADHRTNIALVGHQTRVTLDSQRFHQTSRGRVETIGAAQHFGADVPTDRLDRCRRRM